MTDKFSFTSRKGQSAIEYLMTYGWMLLVVAIAGVAIFSQVENAQSTCEPTVNDIKATDRGFGVSQFTTTSSGINLELQNNQRQTVSVNNVTVNASGTTVELSPQAGSTPVEVSPTESVLFTSSAITQAEEGCPTYDVTLDFESDGVPNEFLGSIEGQMTV
mgnify:CR=1 FL=1